MVKHILFWKFREDCDKAQALADIRAALEGLAGHIPGMTDIRVVAPYKGGYDGVLYSEFVSKEAEEAYQTHPMHMEAKKVVHSYVAVRDAADFEV